MNFLKLATPTDLQFATAVGDVAGPNPVDLCAVMGLRSAVTSEAGFVVAGRHGDATHAFEALRSSR